MAGAPVPPVLLPAELPGGATGVFTTRAGGSSVGRYAALNLATGVGDEPGAVAANRRDLARWLGVDRVSFGHQVHGAEVHVVAGTADHDPSEPTCDALVAATPGTAVAVLVADCVPVLLADPAAGIVAAAHAGRRGLLAGVLPAALAAMTRLGARTERVAAAVGPAVGGCCYEVPAELRDEVAAVVPDSYATTTWGTPALDLPAGAAAVLRAAGVPQVRRLAACTAQDPRFYSYRRDGVTGRFAGVVVAR